MTHRLWVRDLVKDKVIVIKLEKFRSNCGHDPGEERCHAMAYTYFKRDHWTGLRMYGWSLEWDSGRITRWVTHRRLDLDAAHCTTGSDVQVINASPPPEQNWSIRATEWQLRGHLFEDVMVERTCLHSEAHGAV